MTMECKDFGKLYRAAFAEREPERKVILLKQVQDVINQWGQQVVEMPMPPQGVGKEGLRRTA